MSKKTDELDCREMLEKYKNVFDEDIILDAHVCDAVLKDKKAIATMLKIAIATRIPIDADDLYENAWFGCPPSDEPIIKENKDPYKMDMAEAENGYTEVTALTKKNSKFIEAVVALDSNYGSDDMLLVPDYGFNPIRDISSSKKECGSTRYWFTFMKNNHTEEEDKHSVYGAVIAIDRTNSTHLESAVEGRKKMADIILSRCPNYEALLDALRDDFNPDFPESEHHLLYLMSKPIDGKRSETKRCNLSFATKFLAYAAQYLLEDFIYSKYDSVVSEKLPDYSYVYLGEQKNKNYYKANGASKTFEEKMKIYAKYSTDIQRILDKPDVKKAGINRNTFDHIVWYCNK